MCNQYNDLTKLLDKGINITRRRLCYQIFSPDSMTEKRSSNTSRDVDSMTTLELEVLLITVGENVGSTSIVRYTKEIKSPQLHLRGGVL